MESLVSARAKLTLALSAFIVVADDGSIDREASMRNFGEALNKEELRRGEIATEIAQSVHAVFDKYRGVPINMEALATHALRQPLLAARVAENVDDLNFETVLKAEVAAWVRLNSDENQKKDRKTGAILRVAEDAGTRAFQIKKGKGGGVRRWSDIKPGTEE
jgi:hypothetical protein